MIQKTRGLVIHTIKYTDNSVISHIYTEGFGRQAFLIKGTRGKKSSAKINLLQHLSILEMEVYIRQNRDLQRIKEIKLHDNYTSIPYNPTKNGIALFLAEILYRTLREQEQNLPLFSYLLNAFGIFDLKESGFANFHLLFLLGLSRHLGFFPRNNCSSANDYFDIENARFTRQKPLHPGFVSPPASSYLHRLMNCSFEDMGEVKLNTSIRQVLLTGLLDYYRFHVAGMDKVKSFPVLSEVFR